VGGCGLGRHPHRHRRLGPAARAARVRLGIRRVCHPTASPSARSLCCRCDPGVQRASKAQIAAALITIAGLILLLPNYGIEGAAITTTAAYWVALLVSAYYWNVHRGKVLRGEATGHTEQVKETA
jgi:hypothetical protein